MRIAMLLAVFVLLAGKGLAVYPGMSKAELTQELGRPTSKLVHEGKEVWMYPKDVRIELEAGKVTHVKGMEWTDGPAAGQPAGTSAEPAAKGKVPDQPVAPSLPDKGVVAKAPAPDPAAEKAAAEEAARLEKQVAAENARARAEMEKAISRMENRHNAPPLPGRSAVAVAGVIGLVVSLVVKCLLTLAAIFLSAKYWGAEISWAGLLTVAGVDTGVRTGFTLIGELLLKMSSLFYVDEAVAAVVMVLMLRRVSYNRALGQAVTITLTTKTFSIVVGSLLMVFLLNLLH